MQIVNLVGVIAIIVLVVFLLGVVGLMAGRGRRPKHEVMAELVVEHGDQRGVRGDVPTVANTFVEQSGAAPEPSIAPHVTAPTLDRQCPRCGRFDLGESDPGWICHWCQHRWHVGAGEQWPDVALRLWLPRTAAKAEPPQL